MRKLSQPGEMPVISWHESFAFVLLHKNQRYLRLKQQSNKKSDSRSKKLFETSHFSRYNIEKIRMYIYRRRVTYGGKLGL